MNYNIIKCLVTTCIYKRTKDDIHTVSCTSWYKSHCFGVLLQIKYEFNAMAYKHTYMYMTHTSTYYKAITCKFEWWKLLLVNLSGGYM